MSHPLPRSAWWVLALVLLPMLACGRFAPRPGATPTPWPTWTPRPTATPTQAPSPTPTVTPIPPTPTPAPTDTPTPPGSPVVGQIARVVAPNGVNIRQAPSLQAARIGQFGRGVLVRVMEGPVAADGYVWWRVDDEHGKAGWIAEGDRTTRWLDGVIGEPRPVNRAVRLGDTVAVTVPSGVVLAVRYEPGTQALVARRLTAGIVLRVVEGPVVLDGLRWWKVSGPNGISGWAAENDADERWLSPIE
ncbi:MAG: SH3 domain-containing protein [Anaerolineae bacterium]|nr:SH3 domain-containing protein [Anaerolineae bacterium]